jgi:hypothetical protein
MVHRSQIGRGLAAALLVLAAMAPQVGGYAGQVPANIIVAGPAPTLTCVVPMTVTATVMDSNGAPVDDATVQWSIPAGAQPGDQLAASTSVTDAAGVARVSLSLGCRLGDRTIRAADGPAFGQLLLAPGSMFLPGIGTAGSAVGVPANGPFTRGTKVLRLGQYVAFRFGMGASVAGASVQIWTATRNAAGTWTAFRHVTTRVADSRGNVSYVARFWSPTWLSVQARFLGTASARPVVTPAIQARWR